MKAPYLDSLSRFSLSSLFSMRLNHHSYVYSLCSFAKCLFYIKVACQVYQCPEFCDVDQGLQTFSAYTILILHSYAEGWDNIPESSSKFAGLTCTNYLGNTCCHFQKSHLGLKVSSVCFGQFLVFSYWKSQFLV